MDTSAFIQRFESATADLASARESLSEELRNFASETTELQLPATALELLQAPLEEHYVPLDATQRAALDATRGRVEQSHTQLDASLGDLLQQAQTLATEFEQALQEATEQWRADQERLDSSVESLRAAAQEHATTIDGASAELHSSLGQLEEKQLAHESELSGELTPDLLEDIDGFTQTVDGAMASAIETQFLSATEKLAARFETSAAEVAEGFTGALATLGEGADALKQHVAEALKTQLDEGAQQLVDGATRKLIEEVVEGVVVSQTGVAVTSAMSPYLPALIAIKRATDVIKHGLELLKKVTTLGLG